MQYTNITLVYCLKSRSCLKNKILNENEKMLYDADDGIHLPSAASHRLLSKFSTQIGPAPSRSKELPVFPLLSVLLL